MIHINIHINTLLTWRGNMAETLYTQSLKSEEAAVIKVHVPPHVLPRLYSYLDKLETSGVSANQEAVLRDALTVFLEAKGY